MLATLEDSTASRSVFQTVEGGFGSVSQFRSIIVEIVTTILDLASIHIITSIMIVSTGKKEYVIREIRDFAICYYRISYSE
jgi:hypothetical protein